MIYRFQVYVLFVNETQFFNQKSFGFVLLRVDATLGNGYRIWELEFAYFQGSEMYPELFQDLKDDSIEL